MLLQVKIIWFYFTSLFYFSSLLFISLLGRCASVQVTTIWFLFTSSFLPFTSLSHTIKYFLFFLVYFYSLFLLILLVVAQLPRSIWFYFPPSFLPLLPPCFLFTIKFKFSYFSKFYFTFTVTPTFTFTFICGLSGFILHLPSSPFFHLAFSLSHRPSCLFHFDLDFDCIIVWVL